MATTVTSGPPSSPSGNEINGKPIPRSPIEFLWKFISPSKRQDPPSPPPHAPSPATEASPLLGTPRSNDPAEPTVFYLAYGSNLSASTFLGRRGIRPLSSLPVYVPGYILVFNLPGIPYWEPCFANLKKLTDDSKSHVPDLGSDVSEIMTRIEETGKDEAKDKEMWANSLIGVVYEVTMSDYARIIETEGGGQSYRDIEVPCLVLPSSLTPTSPSADDSGISDARSIPSGSVSPKIITAHTLLAPASVYHRTGLQASPRYLNLLITGAGEHALPPAYVQHLKSLHAYHRTTWRQSIGGSILLVTALPLVIITFKIAQLFTDKKTGKAPSWIGWFRESVFKINWGVHDYVFQWIFGSGAHTIGDKPEEVRSEVLKKGEVGVGMVVDEVDVRDAIVDVEEAVVRDLKGLKA